MYPRLLQNTGDICLRCQWRMYSSRSNIRQISSRHGLAPIKDPRPPSRALHLTALRSQLDSTPAAIPPTFDPALVTRPQGLPIRQHLSRWQDQFGGPSEEVLSAFENHPARDDVQNGLSKLSSSFKADENTSANEWQGDKEEEGEELITIGLFLKPGDVVELSHPGREPVLAVFVQQFDRVSQFFSVNGRWTHSILNRVSFAIQGCIDSALLQPLIPYLPTNPDQANPKGEVHVPASIATPVQAMLERMTEEAEKVYRINAPVLDTAYAVLADPARTRMMTLRQIAKTLLARDDPTWTPSPAALLAVRKALNHNEFRFRSDLRSHRLTNVFAIRPKSDVQIIESVHDWIREYREYLAVCANKSQDSTKKRTKGATFVKEFLEKSRRLIAISRKDRDPNMGNLGPSKTRTTKSDEPPTLQIAWGETFTSADKQIINFLQAWVLTGQFRGMAGLHAACASLIQATACYGDGVLHNVGSQHQDATEITRSAGLLFLQEIGVISPHENRVLYDEQLMLPTVRLSRNLELLATKAELTRKNPDFQDSMADLRRDWGSTTVYCIDDAGAQEIDDGVSIERVEGQESEYWLHVHVANPTAFFDKTHTLSGLAAHMTETVYTPERSYPMLPNWATQGYFSLDRNRPVITFSSRIDRNGSVLETKIQHGIIQRIVSMTPSQLASLLGEQDTVVETRKLIVGGKIPDMAPGPLPDLTPDQHQDLHDLFTATKALWETRKAAGAVRFGTPAANVRVLEKAGQGGLTWSPPSIERARHLQGDPVIEVTSVIPEGFIQFSIGAKNIVEELMMLACQVAATWCSERQIPVMFRGTIEPPLTQDGERPEQIKQLVMDHLKEHDSLPLDLAMRYTRSLGRAIAHSAPLPHKIIGVPSYVKVTSPLRRFSDMIAHWQIEAAIRYEARSGKKFNATEHTKASRSILPFSQRQMQESIVTLSPRERIISTTKREAARYWCVMAIMRAFLYKEAEVPDTFKLWIRTVPDAATKSHASRGIQGHLPEYGIRAVLLEDPEVEVGDEWEVKLDSVDVFIAAIYVRPVRLLSRIREEP